MIVTYFTYQIWAYKNLGRLSSISEGYYQLRKIYGVDKDIYFTVWCGLTALLTAIPLHEITQGDWWQIITLPTCLGLLIVGVCPKYQDDQYKYWHYAGAALSAAGAIIIVICEGWTWGLVGSAVICGALNFITKEKDIMLWSENVCFLSLIFAMVAGVIKL